MVELFSSWWLLAILSGAGYAAVLAFTSPDARRLRQSLLLGFFFVGFDFIVENIGAATGWWVSLESSFFLLAVPWEVSVIAFFTGAAYALLFPPRFDVRLALPLSLLIAAVGAGIETKLIQSGLLSYGNGWSAVLAFASYALSFVILSLAHARISPVNAEE